MRRMKQKHMLEQIRKVRKQVKHDQNIKCDKLDLVVFNTIFVLTEILDVYYAVCES